MHTFDSVLHRRQKKRGLSRAKLTGQACMQKQLAGLGVKGEKVLWLPLFRGLGMTGQLRCSLRLSFGTLL